MVVNFHHTILIVVLNELRLQAVRILRVIHFDYILYMQMNLVRLIFNMLRKVCRKSGNKLVFHPQ